MRPDRGVAGLQAAVLEEPERRPGRRVRLPDHHLLDQAPERLDPGLILDAVEETGVVDVPGG